MGWASPKTARRIGASGEEVDVAHGPQPRDFSKKLTKKAAKLAFRRALSAKIDQGDVTVIDELALAAPKTKEFTAVLKNLGIDRGALFIVDEASDNLLLASRNIPRVEVATAKLVNTYQVLRYKSVKPDEQPLRMRLRELAAARPRFGYRRLHVLLRREGWPVNMKRIRRLYRLEGLQLRHRLRRRTGACTSQPPRGGAEPTPRERSQRTSCAR